MNLYIETLSDEIIFSLHSFFPVFHILCIFSTLGGAKNTELS
jgi:hypothetical protein